MKIKCLCCGDCFEPSEDHLRWPSSEDANPDDSGKIVWEKIPLLRSTWSYDEYDKNNQSHKQTDRKIAGEKH